MNATLTRLRESFDEDPFLASLVAAALGPNFRMTGAERGFAEKADALIQAVDGTDLNDFWDEVNAAVALRNRNRSALVDLLTYRVTDMSEQVTIPAGGDDFEIATEYGLPKATKVGVGNTFWRGYDFNFYDLAVRFTWMYIAEANIRDLRSQLNAALESDNRLVFSKIMRGLLNPVNASGITDNNLPVTVYRFYNGDGEVPPTVNGTSFVGTHNHYLTSTGIGGGNSLVPATVEAMQTQLDHHGYSLLSGYRHILFVNTQEYNIIRTWKVSGGATWDFIPSNTALGGGVFVLDSASGRYVGVPEGLVPGQVGTYGPWHVVLNDLFPAGYLVGIVTGGPDQLTNPIGFREHKNPRYRGLKVIPGNLQGYPLVESFFQRGLGVGIRQRGAGVVMQISASGTYAVPAIYA